MPGVEQLPTTKPTKPEDSLLYDNPLQRLLSTPPPQYQQQAFSEFAPRMGHARAHCADGLVWTTDLQRFN
jgi:hypothetical protein